MVKIIEEQIDIHNKLNPKIWSNNKLIPEVRNKIIDISKEFKNYVELSDMSIIDVHLVGSNASFNYTDNSDLDVHIIVNFDLIDASKEVIQAMYNSERKSFNKDYDINIYGINVELYVEDVRSNTVSNGIYSVYNNEWIRFPEKLDNIPDIDLEPELSRLMGHIYTTLNGNSIYAIEDWINSLYLIRRNSLATEGEYGKGNQIFKQIRNEGLLNQLKDKRLELKSKILSLEKIMREYYSNYSCNILTESSIMSPDDSPFEVMETDREDHDNYIIATELVRMKEDDPGTEVEMKSVYSKIDGSYVGDIDFAMNFYDKGILPQSYNPDKCRVATIGFCDKEQKWYGWSHRAIYGFGIGDKIVEDHLCSEYLPVGFECEDLDDCKMCAIAFAKAVD